MMAKNLEYLARGDGLRRSHMELAALGKLWRRNKDPPLQLSAPPVISIFDQAESFNTKHAINHSYAHE